VADGSTAGLVAAAADRAEEHWDDPVRGRLGFVTFFSGDSTATRELTTGLATVPAGGWLGLHRHAAAETYFVLDGEGIVTLRGMDHSVGPGSAVFIPGDSQHGVRNTGSEPLRVFYAFAAHAMADITYHFEADAGEDDE
jgi:mannose-6-phosphate isomerase-like protein (cupin superfamily)